MRYFLHFAYNGEEFHGWQIQDGQTSVQEALQTALGHIFGKEIELIGCGRTDTGVHASDFYAHFDHIELSESERKQVVYRLNRYFVHNILIYDLLPMKDDAHARFDAVSRTYKYHLSITKQPFRNSFCYYHPWELDVEKMNLAAKKLLGRKDFTSFSKLHTQVNNNICTITEAYWEEVDGELVFTISANRFLRNMVRAIVGTLLAVGRGKMTLKEFEQIIECKDRCRAGVSVPAKALFLYKVDYPENIFERNN
jgi:tRNA pseudouridine38-40 synthase